MRLSHKSIFTLALTTAIAAGVALSPALADAKKTKEITKLVGYNVTEEVTIESALSPQFNKIDRDSNGSLSFKEYAAFSTVNNEYDMFLRMDRNGDKSVSLEEFSTFEATKGNTSVDSALHGKSVKGTNLKTRALPSKKTYYMPVEPEIVSEKSLVEPTTNE